MNPMGYPLDMGDSEVENLDDESNDNEYIEDNKDDSDSSDEAKLEDKDNIDLEQLTL